MPCEYWKSTVAILNEIKNNLLHHGMLTNERYIHHYFSNEMQKRHPDIMNLFSQTDSILLHPEWPTFKKCINNDYGQYQKKNGSYLVSDCSRKGGFIDFAIGSYRSPSIAVEFKLTYGWQRVAMTFDYLKLIDTRNPFKFIVQYTTLLRSQSLSDAGKRDAICKAMDDAFTEAMNRAGNVKKNSEMKKRFRLIVTEIAPDGSRTWYRSEGDEQFTFQPEEWSIPV